MQYVFYDQDCFYCRQLAAFLRQLLPSGIFVVGQNPIPASLPEEVHYALEQSLHSESELQFKVWDGSSMLIGPDAWSWMLENFPGLSRLHWLAERLGMNQTLVNTIDLSSKALRWTCISCRR